MMSSSGGVAATPEHANSAATNVQTETAAVPQQTMASGKAADKRAGRRSDRRNDEDSERPVVNKDPLLSKRTVALHTGYVGTSYKGSCINRTLGHDVTIEQVLERAIFEAGLMLETNYGSFSRTRWSRASRTDKGVHSLGTVMGLRMLVDDRCYSLPKPSPHSKTTAASKDDGAASEAAADPCAAFCGDTEGSSMAARINAHLPQDVRVFAVQKVNKKFNARHMCADRTYDYYLPASLLGLACDGGEADAQKVALLREALNVYVGYKPFHNFTKRSHHEAERSSKHSARKAQRTEQQQPEGTTQGTDTAMQDANQSVAAADAGTDAGAALQDPTPSAVPTGLAGTQAQEGQGAQADAAMEPAAVAIAGTQVEAAAATAGTQVEAAAQVTQQAGVEQHGNQAAGTGSKRLGKRRKDAEESDEGGGESDDWSEGGGELEGDDDDDVLADTTADAVEQQLGASKPRRPLLLKFNEAPDPKDIIGKTYYRQIKSFTADDPTPLVQGGTPCLKLTVHGQSFMLHHIRHMIGAAVAVAHGLLSLELLQAAVSAPARMALPRAPPHTLILSDCTFHPFPKQHGTGDNDLINVTGPRLQLREGGHSRKEAFRQQVLLPALQQQVTDVQDWDKWSAALEAAYPFPEQEQQAFLVVYRKWVDVMRAKREAKAAREGDVDDEEDEQGEGGSEDGQEGGDRQGKRHRPTPQQRQRWGRGGGPQGSRGRGRGGGARGRGGRRGG